MASNSTTGSTGDILIVDDSLDNLRVLSTTLIERGYDVRCVKSGAMALIGIQTSPPDLILLDIRMPNMDGFETCRRIKQNSQTRSIPVIFLSALDEVADKVRAFEVGGVDYITKPFQVEEVLARVEHQLTIQRLQKQLTEQNQRLQNEIYQHQQTEAALKDAKEAADAANYAKSVFLARMSHELRTPLNAILGFTELMQGDSSLPKDYQDYLETVHLSGQHLLKLINNILTMVQAESSQISLNEEQFDLLNLLNEVETTWQPNAAEAGVQLNVSCAPGLPQFIYSDESKLRQILHNVLENAIKFTPQGQVSVRVEGFKGQRTNHKTEESNSRRTIDDPSVFPVKPDASLSERHSSLSTPYTLLFKVEDTGLGIAAYELSNLFEVFSQTETGRKSLQGVGLGLPISRQFAQSMGGDITVTSEPGKGTQVSFYVQVGQVDASFPVVDSTWPIAYTQPFVKQSHTHLQPVDEVSSEALQALMSSEWMLKLYQAAIKGCDRQILQLLDEIPTAHTSLAQQLARWTDDFQFDRIVELTRPVSN